MSIARKVTEGAGGGGSGGSSKYVDDVFSTYLYEGTGANRDIVNGIELGSRPANMTQSLEWPVGATYRVQVNGFYPDGLNWTMDYWCKFTADPASTQEMSIFDTRTNDNSKFAWQVFNGEMRLTQSDIDDLNTGYYPWVEHPNEWVHHVLTYSDGVLSFFVNGNRFATQPSGRLRYGSQQIGGSLYSSSAYLSGCLLSNFRGTSLSGCATSLTFPVPEGPSSLAEDTDCLLFTENTVAPGTECMNSSASGVDPVLYDRARGTEAPGSNAGASGVRPLASADSPYSNAGYEGKGGLVWIKCRDQGFSHILCDTERGPNNKLESQSPAGEAFKASISAFNSDGFSLDAASLETNSAGPPSPADYASWTWAKQEGFFDVVTYTGDSVAGREIPHNLGSVPGMVIVKSTSRSSNWSVLHKDCGLMYLNLDSAAYDEADTATNFGDGTNRIDPTSTEFTIGRSPNVNQTDDEYVAYLFADDAPMFGPNGDESIIKCGSVGPAGTVDVDLGWEPQFLLWKQTDGANDWYITDTMRGFTSTSNAVTLRPSQSAIENASNGQQITSTGFTFNTRGNTHIYMAIRRPMKPAEEFEPDELFDIGTYVGDGATVISAIDFPFDTDMFMLKRADASGKNHVFNRLTGYPLTGGNQPLPYLATSETDTLIDAYTFRSSDARDIAISQDGSTNICVSGGTYITYGFRRAPGFFDVVTYKGDNSGSNSTPWVKKHNLGAVPEMMWVKNITRDLEKWPVYSKSLSITEALILNDGNPRATENNYWINAPTDTEFTLGGGQEINNANSSYIAFLWASVPGVCDIGSYTGTGNDLTIDCGFTTGARFVLIKRIDTSGEWLYFDTLRGITNGDSPRLRLNTIDAQNSGSYVKPLASGFTATSNLTGIDGGTYIYMAIA